MPHCTAVLAALHACALGGAAVLITEAAAHFVFGAVVFGDLVAHASAGAQSVHHRCFFPSDGSPRLGAFRPQPSHLWTEIFFGAVFCGAASFLAAFCFFGAAFFAVVGFFDDLVARASAGAQSLHHRRFFPSDGSPRLGAFRPQPSHLLPLVFTAPS